MMRRTLIELAFASVLLVGILGAYAYWYLLVADAREESALLSAQVREKSREAARVEDARAALESLAADEAMMQGYMVRPDDIVPFLGSLESTASALGSSLEVVSVTDEPGEERGSIILSLRIEGSFDAVLRTLGALEYGAYDSAIENVTFDTVPAGEGAAASWSAAVTFALGTKASAQ